MKLENGYDFIISPFKSSSKRLEYCMLTTDEIYILKYVCICSNAFYSDSI